MLKNTFWIFIDRAWKAASSFLLFFYFADVLSQEEFGELSYAMSISALFLPFLTLGYPQILANSMALDTQNQTEYLSAAVYSRLVISIVVWSIVAIIAQTLYSQLQWLGFLVILLLASVFRSFNSIDNEFEVSKRSLFSFLARAAGSLGVLVFLVLAAGNEASIYVLLFVLVVEAMLVAIVLLLTSKSIRFYPTASLRVLYGRVCEMLGRSWPIIWSAISIVLYLKVDQMMIFNLLGEVAAGEYAMAIKIVEASYLAPMVTSSALLPFFSVKSQNSLNRFHEALKAYFCAMTMVSFIVASACYALALIVVDFYFVNRYTSVPQIVLYMLPTIPIVYFSVLKGPWSIINNRQRANATYTCVGLILNVLLNYFLVSRYGAFGAVVATFTSQLAVNIVLPCFVVKDREVIRLLIESVYISHVIKVTKYVTDYLKDKKLPAFI